MAALGIKALFLGIVIIRDLKNVIKFVNDNAVADEQNKVQIFEKFHEFIAFHAMIKELSV